MSDEHHDEPMIDVSDLPSADVWLRLRHEISAAELWEELRKRGKDIPVHSIWEALIKFGNVPTQNLWDEIVRRELDEPISSAEIWAVLKSREDISGAELWEELSKKEGDIPVRPIWDALMKFGNIPVQEIWDEIVRREFDEAIKVSDFLNKLVVAVKRARGGVPTIVLKQDN